MPVGLLSRLRKDCNVTAPPSPQGVEEKKKICSRFVRTRNRNVPVPSTDKAPATRYQMAHYGTGPDRMDRQAVSLVAGQYCMSRTVSVIGSFSRRQARHVARCTLHVARCSLLVARCLWSGSSSQPASQSANPQGPGTPGTKHPEDGMQLHVLHHMDDRGSRGSHE